jgi:hypothetical protein
MSHCGDKSFKIGKLCISYDDYYIFLLNILIIIILTTIFYIKKASDTTETNSVIVKNNFTLLGEGALNNFFSPLNAQQKNPTTKKKVQAKTGNQPTIPEKAPNNNELKCNNCGRSVEVSYQYTMHKLSNF